MSTSTFTRVENDLVSGSLLSGLTGDNVKALNFQAALAPNAPIVLTTANYTMSVDDWVQAAISKQIVDGTGLTATRTLVVGPDAQSQAASYVGLFNLSSGEQSKVVLDFQLGGGDVAGAFDVALGNSSGTTTWVSTLLNGGGAAATNVLFDNSNGLSAGSRAVCEVWATNTTSGSETVVFNVQSVLQG